MPQGAAGASQATRGSSWPGGVPLWVTWNTGLALLPVPSQAVPPQCSSAPGGPGKRPRSGCKWSSCLRVPGGTGQVQGIPCAAKDSS